MSTTLKAIRREMYQRLPGNALGRLESIAALTTTTCVVNALAVGALSADVFKGKYMIRAEAASSADRVRRITDYTASSGTLTHAGTNYADTTATNEFVEIVQVEPTGIDNAIQTTLQSLVRLDREIFPYRFDDSYWLDGMAWIAKPSDVQRVAISPNPVLNRDRQMEKWNTVSTGGTLQLDWWVLTGAAATLARSSSSYRSGYSAQVTRAGTDAALTQTIGLQQVGVSQESWAGRTLNFGGWVKSSTANHARLFAGDGTQTATTGYHTGGGTWELLTSTINVAAAATTLTLGGQINTSDAAASFDDLWIAEQYDNNVLRDAYTEFELPAWNWRFDQSGTANRLIVPPKGRNGQVVVYSMRPFPGFDSTRLAAGTADADTTDAPLTIVALGAIWRLFDGLSLNPGQDTSRYRQIAQEYKGRFQKMAAAYLRADNPGHWGAPMPMGGLGPAARRF